MGGTDQLCRILVIDDEEQARAAVARRLSRDGYEVKCAASEEEGLDVIKSNEMPFDIVVTDMVMESPDSGLEILKAAFARDIFTEVIVLTAYGNVANAVECMKRGAFDYVEKNIPGIDVYELLTLKVQQAMDHRKSSVNTIRRLDQAVKPR
ncbi:MAG: response regulator [Armatimonadota bacterium]|nr:response regulator [Armatimonadota bacterium]